MIDSQRQHDDAVNLVRVVDSASSILGISIVSTLLSRNCGCLSRLNVVKSISCADASPSTCSRASATAGTPVGASGRMVHSACAASSSRWKL